MRVRYKSLLLLALAVFVIPCILTRLTFLSSPGGKPLASDPSPSQKSVELDPNPGQDASFSRVTGPIPLKFPEDLGAHRNYLSEWWYYTGNLTSDEGRQFGFQLTFFRRGIIPPHLQQDRESSWATGQVYLAHLALSDINARKFIYEERISREAAGLAGTRSAPMKIWLYDWKIENTAPNIFELAARTSRLKLSLRLEDGKGITLQGDQGYSPKGPQAGNASMYFSQTRLLTRGIISLDGKTYTVHGTSWMDHEFSTSALSQDQIGWDWFALQLDNGSELMVYTIRQSNGEIDPYSSGKIIYPDGSTSTLTFDQFEIQVLDTWKSPHSKAVYPSKWKLTIPEKNIELIITPMMSDQELNLSFIYWEGAVSIEGMFHGDVTKGKGYAELTGYAEPFRGEF